MFAVDCRKIVEQHLQSDAMLVILPWQDWMAMDKKLALKNPHAERINVPADREISGATECI